MSIIIFNLSRFSEYLLPIQSGESELFQTGQWSLQSSLLLIMYKSLKRKIIKIICMSTNAHVKQFMCGHFKSEDINSDTSVCLHH